jgi:hypothetical protein
MNGRIERPEYEKVKAVLEKMSGGGTHDAYAARQYLNGWDAGREAGLIEAQRFLRLMLGIDLPDMDERAYWMCPFPLMPEPKEKS